MSKIIEIEVFSVDEKSPTPNKTVCGHWNDGIWSAVYFRSGKFWMDETTETPVEADITHWCELPKLED